LLFSIHWRRIILDEGTHMLFAVCCLLDVKI
jgi:hypothetical protein